MGVKTAKHAKHAKKMHEAPNLEPLAQASNLKPERLLSFAKERLGEVKRQVPVILNSYLVLPPEARILLNMPNFCFPAPCIALRRRGIPLFR